MTVPTINAVTPAVGLTKGRSRVLIAGTGFRLPPTPPPGYRGGTAQVTVRVTVGGVACPRAAALSATLLECYPAPWAGSYELLPIALDVRVANLDNAGVEIGGEAVTAAAAYTVRRPPLAEETCLQRTVRALITALRTHLLREVDLVMSRDWEGAADGVPRQTPTLPSVSILGPTIRLNPDWQPAHPPTANPADAPYGWIQSAPPVVVDLEFDVHLQGDAMMHTAGLLQALLLHVRDLGTITVDGQDYPCRIPIAGTTTVLPTPNGADLYLARCPLIIQGVQLTENSGMVQIDAAGRTVYANSGLASVTTAAR